MYCLCYFHATASELSGCDTDYVRPAKYFFFNRINLQTHGLKAGNKEKHKLDPFRSSLSR